MKGKKEEEETRVQDELVFCCCFEPERRKVDLGDVRSDQLVLLDDALARSYCRGGVAATEMR
jgi:hypothetical protein